MSRSPGPKRLPTERKKLAATHKPSRDHPSAPTPSRARPAPPDHFNPEELEAFDLICARLEGERRLSASHTEVIALAAMRIAEIAKLKEHIEARGYVYESATDRSEQPMLRKNPSAELLNTASRSLHSLLAELGLTPASVSKVGSAGEEAPKNPFNDLPN